MAMKLIREAKKTEYKVEDGKTLVVMQPEIYQRIYCKNCGEYLVDENFSFSDNYDADIFHSNEIDNDEIDILLTLSNSQLSVSKKPLLIK